MSGVGQPIRVLAAKPDNLSSIWFNVGVDPHGGRNRTDSSKFSELHPYAVAGKCPPS